MERERRGGMAITIMTFLFNPNWNLIRLLPSTSYMHWLVRLSVVLEWMKTGRIAKLVLQLPDKCSHKNAIIQMCLHPSRRERREEHCGPCSNVRHTKAIHCRCSKANMRPFFLFSSLHVITLRTSNAIVRSKEKFAQEFPANLMQKEKVTSWFVYRDRAKCFQRNCFLKNFLLKTKQQAGEVGLKRRDNQRLFKKL